MVSTTDPDATHLRQRDGIRLGYQDHYVVDGGKARIILSVLVASAEVMEDRPARDLLWHARFRWQLWPRHVTGDTAYGTLALIRAVEEQHLHAYSPLPHLDGHPGFFGKQDFVYDPERDAYTCPGGALLPYIRPNRPHRLLLYQADAATCHACALKAQCTTSAHGRMLSRNYEEEYLDQVRSYRGTEPPRARTIAGASEPAWCKDGPGATGRTEGPGHGYLYRHRHRQGAVGHRGAPQRRTVDERAR